MLLPRARTAVRFYGTNPKNFSGDFLAEIGQNTHFDTRLCSLEGKSGVRCLVAFFISAGSAFVNLFNQVARRAHVGDFGPQPRVKVGFLSNLAQYFYRKNYSQRLSIKLVNKGNIRSALVLIKHNVKVCICTYLFLCDVALTVVLLPLAGS